MLLFYFSEIVEVSTVCSYTSGLLCRSEWCDDVQPASRRWCSYVMHSTGWLLDPVPLTQVNNQLCAVMYIVNCQ